MKITQKIDEAKAIYSIILDLWKFTHKYLDVMSSGNEVNWDEFVNDYVSEIDDKQIGVESIDALRMNLFFVMWGYFQDKRRDKHGRLGKRCS